MALTHGAPSTAVAASDVSVVVCAYTERRWADLYAAVQSVRVQTHPARELIVVIDNNPQLLARVRRALPGVIAVHNTGARGAGAARNRGVALATGSIIAFLDDDAIATPAWIERATLAFAEEHVLGVGGIIRASWEGRRPPWMATEFYWTVGCTYPGLPTEPAPVRNLIAANMFVRRDAFLGLGGFRPGFGKTGARSGTEETDLCIRASQRWPACRWLYDPAVAVAHRVPRSRARLSYFVSRCYDEGLAKASIVSFLGAGDGLASERVYTTRTLPRGVLTGLRDTLLRGDVAGVARSASIVVGLTATLVGYLRGRLTNRHSTLRLALPLGPHAHSEDSEDREDREDLHHSSRPAADMAPGSHPR